MPSRSRNLKSNPFMARTSLSEKQAAAIIGHFVKNSSTRATAKALHITPKTVASWNTLLVERINVMKIETACCMLPINNSCIWVREDGKKSETAYEFSRDFLEKTIEKRFSVHRIGKNGGDEDAPSYKARRAIYIQVLSIALIFERQAPHQSFECVLERAESQVTKILKESILRVGPLNVEADPERLKEARNPFFDVIMSLVVKHNHPGRWPVQLRMLTGHQRPAGQSVDYVEIGGHIFRVDPKQVAQGKFDLIMEGPVRPEQAAEISYQ